MGNPNRDPRPYRNVDAPISRALHARGPSWHLWVSYGFYGFKCLAARAAHCKPIEEELFAWLGQVLAERVLVPSNPFTEAARYARARPLRVFLDDPAVPIDTNHLEREIRPIAVGRRNCLFCWTEVGAKCVGIFQSLLATCRLQAVDPSTYLVEVLQRVDDHPAREVALLTARLWKEHFADNPRGSDIDRQVNNAGS